MRSTVHDEDWPQGYYGLVHINDPDFVWMEKPELDPIHGCSIDTLTKEMRDRLDVWREQTSHMQESFYCMPHIGYRLFKACLEAGYQPSSDQVIFWLRHHLAQKIKEEEVEKITKEHVQAILAKSKIEDVKMGEKSTVVCVTLPNGFTIIQSSSCVDPRNYDHELGRKLCMERVENEIWKLEGYLLQDQLSKVSNASLMSRIDV